MIKHKQFHHKAFTLIEILLGLTIFSIVSLTLYNVFWLGIKIQNKADIINKSYQEAYTALEVMANDIENAIFYDFSSSYPQESSLKGQPESVSLVISTNQGLKKIRYYLDLPNWGKTTQIIINQRINSPKSQVASFLEDLPIQFLMRQENLLMESLLNQTQDKGEEILAASIKRGSLKFQYAAKKVDSNKQASSSIEMEWKNDWQESALPVAIRVEMVIYEPNNSKEEVVLRREIYLSPLEME